MSGAKDIRTVIMVARERGTPRQVQSQERENPIPLEGRGRSAEKLGGQRKAVERAQRQPAESG